MTLDPIAAQNIADDRVREAYAHAARMESLLAGMVARLGGHVVTEPDDYRYAILINGNELTTRVLPQHWPIVSGRGLGKSFSEDDEPTDLEPPEVKPWDHDEPIGDNTPLPFSH